MAMPVSAQEILLSDNFNAENGGLSKTVYTGFANWNVTTGTVDLVRSGDFNITCSGSCVDLDGSPGPGALTTKLSYSFNAGDVMRFAFSIGGSQRVTNQTDPFNVRISFNAPLPNIASASYFIGGSVIALDPTNPVGFFDVPGTIGSNAAFLDAYFEFTAASAGSVKFGLGTTSANNIGPLIDNVVITRTTAVPEPASVVLIAAGLAGLGVTARRRRA